MVGEVSKSMPKINVALEDHQGEYKMMMAEFKGKIFIHVVEILIDLGDSLSDTSPKIAKACHLQTIKFKIPWLV